MKITKEANGNIYIYNSSNYIEHIITESHPFLGKHPRNDKGVLISKKASNQYEQEAITVYSNKVTHINGSVFTGNRNDLLKELGTLFSADGETTTETPEPDKGGGTSAPLDPGTGFRVNPQEETEKTATKPAVSMQKSNAVAPVNNAKSLTIWQQIKKFFSDIYKKMNSVQIIV